MTNVKNQHAPSADTIVAPATASGRSGVGIVRLSGPDAKQIALKIIHPKMTLRPRIAQLACFYDAHHQIIDEGMTLFFEKPRSFTGEDVVELQAHGSPIVIDQLIQVALYYGARCARPGEFSERAFLNNKMDLTQAEAIADLINAHSVQAAQSALRSLQGEFSKKIHVLQAALTQLRMHVESAIDFPEEEIHFLNDHRITDLLQKTIDDVLAVKKQAKQGVLLQSGLQVVIVGKPNVGKSSLLNYLSGRDSAIVTDIPGTTRDILRESIQLDSLLLHIVDTAGLRDTANVIEQEGIKRAYAHIHEANVVLLMTDVTETRPLADMISDFQKSLSGKIPMMVIKNKIDLINENPHISEVLSIPVISLSIQNQLGMPLLIDYLKKIAGFQTAESDGFIARRRHVDALSRADTYLRHGQEQLQQHHAGELLAEDLRQAQLALSDITGEFSSDDLLGEIFSHFCIGK